jgi:hypothetical protein
MLAYRSVIGVGVALTSVALMSTELVLTRIFSVVVWYHFAFFAISVALFGTGAAAVAVQLRQRAIAAERTNLVLVRSAIALAMTIAAVDFLLVNVTPDWFAGGSSQFTTLTTRLSLTFMLAAAPFFVGGFTLSLALSRYVASAHRLYFWDLGGAASACVVVVPLLSWLGGPGALLFAAALAAGAAVAFSRSLETRTRRSLAAVAVGTALACVLGGIVAPRTGLLEVRVAKGIDLRRVRPEYNRWNAFSTVTVLPEVGFRGWGMSPVYDGAIPPQKTLVIDMNAMTTLTQFDGSFDAVRHASFDLSALVWAVRNRTERACVIGAGGGKDVLAALAGGAAHVTAVEINPLIVNDVMRGKFRDFVGDLYGRPDVTVHVADGRSFVRATEQRFDVILLSMVDTSAATAAGAYALTENSLYTADAFRDFIAKLEPDGILSVSTASLEGLAVGARLAAIARTVLHDVHVKPRGFDVDEAERFERLARERGFVPVHVPGRSVQVSGPEQLVIQRILTATDEAALQHELARLPLDVTPVDDERPFFFYQNRLSDFPRALVATGTSHLFGNGLVILAKVLLIALALTGVFIGVPVMLRRNELRAGAGSPIADVTYVACLGVGFMFVEIGAIQRLSTYLGQPTYTLAVVLFVLLLAGAVGSRSFSRVQGARLKRTLSWVLVAISGYALVFAFGARTVLDATATLPTEGRAAVAAGLLAPLGFLLGVPFPSGLFTVGQRAPARIPWLFSVNSATSVLGSIVATLVALHAGIGKVSLVGAFAYLLAAALWARVGAQLGHEEPAVSRNAAAAG